MPKIESHYDSSPDREWDRLGKKNPIEFAITMLALSEYLPQPLAHILDIGGGPGRYAIALTQQGYSVTLLDLSRGNLEFARARANEANAQLADYIRGNALDLISREGLVTMIDDKLNELAEEAWESWVTLNYAWAKDPAVHGMAEHLLYVGRKL